MKRAMALVLALAGAAVAQSMSTPSSGSSPTVTVPATSTGEPAASDGGVTQVLPDGGIAAATAPAAPGNVPSGQQVYSFDPPPVGEYSFSVTPR